MPIIPFGDSKPKVDPMAYVSPQATVVGDVEIAAKVSIWPGAVIRGDQSSVKIGERTAIQDSVVIHAHTKDNPAIIGSNVTVCTAAVLHGVYVGDAVNIGEGCVVFDGATLGEGVVLAPGSIVPPNIVIPPRSLNAGVPAVQVREVTREEVNRQEMKAETVAMVFQKLRRWQQSV
ncbi:MAG: gamma carbonic anhydrase family protein [Candidatus Thorarchaeota archaeon]|nr:gamma carbonic anhydrase family protein [Candidatus Thorarchaeota archaeon]